jgi:ABC-type transport system involved in multi-copper enzyme maturation permease subunit
MLRAIRAEVLKLKGSMMPLWTALIVLVAPCITVSTFELAGTGAAGARWADFMLAGPQLVASWYGTVLFGLVASYLFGREHNERTEEQMLTLPVRREYFLAAKMIVLTAWVLGLTLLSFFAQAGYAAAVGVQGSSWADAGRIALLTLEVAVLIYAALPWVALVAMIGRGYLAPMVYASLAAAVGLGLAEAGWGRWFPWSMQLSVTGVALFPSVPMPTLVGGSWALMALMFVTGCAAAVWHVDRADA